MHAHSTLLLSLPLLVVAAPRPPARVGRRRRGVLAAAVPPWTGLRIIHRGFVLLKSTVLPFTFIQINLDINICKTKDYWGNLSLNPLMMMFVSHSLTLLLLLPPPPPLPPLLAKAAVAAARGGGASAVSSAGFPVVDTKFIICEIFEILYS